jgi:hypothetical protein
MEKRGYEEKVQAVPDARPAYTGDSCYDIKGG